MKNIWRKTIALFAGAALATTSMSYAADLTAGEKNDNVTNVVVRNRVEVLGADSIDSKIISQLASNVNVLDEKVIVGNDTVNIIIPERNVGRYDRGIFNYLFIHKGQCAYGIDESYGDFKSEYIDWLSLVCGWAIRAIRPIWEI